MSRWHVCSITFTLKPNRPWSSGRMRMLTTAYCDALVDEDECTAGNPHSSPNNRRRSCFKFVEEWTCDAATKVSSTWLLSWADSEHGPLLRLSGNDEWLRNGPDEIALTGADVELPFGALIVCAWDGFSVARCDELMDIEAEAEATELTDVEAPGVGLAPSRVLTKYKKWKKKSEW